MLKAEMHSHCNDDPEDPWIGYGAEELMEEAARQGFDVLSITLHNKLYFPERYAEKAEDLDLCLIPGVELNIEGRDVLAYNITEEEAESVEKISDLKGLKRKDTLIVAPHPYLPKADSLHEALDEYHDCFDAVEKTLFYLPFFKYWNSRAERASEKYGLPMVANSDVHRLWNLGYSYTLIDAEKNVGSVISAVKEGRVQVVSRPLSIFHASSIVFNNFFFGK